MKQNFNDLYLNGNSHINVGTGEQISIRDLVKIISQAFSFNGKVTFDVSKPDGMPKKCMDISLINNLGWQSDISVRDGINKICMSYG